MVFMFICFFMVLCTDLFIDSFIVGQIWIFMFICSLMFFCVNSFIAGKISIFLFICSFMFLGIDSLIDSFIVGKISIFMFICSFMFLCLNSFTDSFIAGKAMKILRNQHTVDLVMSEEKLKKLAAQPSFKQFKIFHENLVTIEQAKVKLTLNQPFYGGVTILDLSKTLMYDFQYNYIKRKCTDSTVLTDSLLYQIQIDNFFDCSGYEKESPIYDITKEIGKMKDEFNGETIGKLVSLRVKTYSLKTKKEEKGSEGKQTVNECD